MSGFSKGQCLDLTSLLDTVFLPMLAGEAASPISWISHVCISCFLVLHVSHVTNCSRAVVHSHTDVTDMQTMSVQVAGAIFFPDNAYDEHFIHRLMNPKSLSAIQLQQWRLLPAH